MQNEKLQTELERRNEELEQKRNKILTNSEVNKVQELAFNGMSSMQIITMLGLNIHEFNPSFNTAFYKGKFEGEAELKRIYFEQARKGNLRNADKIFNKNRL